MLQSEAVGTMPEIHRPSRLPRAEHPCLAPPTDLHRKIWLFVGTDAPLQRRPPLVLLDLLKYRL